MDVFELTPTQQAMFDHAAAAPNAHFDQICYSYCGALDVAAFAQAWQRVIDRHPILRTSFCDDDTGQPGQVVHDRVELPLTENDWRGLSAPSQVERLTLLLEEDRDRGFDLERAPLLRLALIHTDNENYYLIFSYHHLILDSWSLSLVRSEVSQVYRALKSGGRVQLEPARGFGDYVEWLRERSLDEAENFWRRELRALKAPSAVAIVHAPGMLPAADQVFGEREVWLPAWLTADLQSFARNQRLTMSTVVQGTWAILLSRYCATDDVSFGIMVSGRPRELTGSDSMLGPLSNVQPLRVSLSQQDSIVSYFRKLQGGLVIQRAYEHASLKQIQSWSEVPNTIPLVESVVAFENFQTATASLDLGGRMSVYSAHLGRTSHPLLLMATPGDEVGLRMIYQRAGFEDGAIERMLKNLTTLLDEMTENPERPVESLKLLIAVEPKPSLIGRSKLRLILPVKRKAG